MQSLNAADTYQAFPERCLLPHDPAQQRDLQTQAELYPALPHAQLQHAGILGAYDRMKRRHQTKYSHNPNPKRAVQKNLRKVDQHELEAGARNMDKIDQEALSEILAMANGGQKLGDDELFSIFIQCDPDDYGLIKSSRVGEALGLLKQNRKFYSKMSPVAPAQPNCECIIS